MRSARRHQFIIRGAILLIVAASLLYALLAYDWIKGLGPAAKPSASPSSGRLEQARSEFRVRFLAPDAHLRLAEALNAAQRPIDAFYVRQGAWALFGEKAFTAAHAQIVLGQAAATSAVAEPADARAAVTAWARSAAEHPGTFEARAALESLGRLAQRKPSSSEDEETQLAQEALEELSHLRPDDPRIFSTLAMAAWTREGPRAARSLVDEALAKHRGQAGALMVDGALALQEGNEDKAVRQFRAAWAKNPEDIVSASKLAQIYYKERGDGEAALPFYLAIHRMDPRANDGEPVDVRIQQILDARREASLGGVPVGGLGNFLSSDDASLRAEACVRAAVFKDPRWIGQLFELLDDDTEIVRHNADYALYQIAKTSRAAIMAHREEWLGSEKPLARCRALNLFSDLDPADTLSFVEKALRDPSPTVRYLARVMVLDHYYKDSMPAAKIRTEYLSHETDPAVLALYARLKR